MGMVSHFWETPAAVVGMVAPPVTNPPSNVRVVDDDIAERPRPEDLVRLSVPLTRELTAELDGAMEIADVGVVALTATLESSSSASIRPSPGSFRKNSLTPVRLSRTERAGPSQP
jgi:hypothetical protein